MVKDDLTRILHIYDACTEIIHFTKNITKTQFRNNRMLQLAIVHLFEIIGEAANSISVEIPQKYPSIPWKSLIGMRNRLIHGYFDIDLNIVWQTIQSDIPFLLKEIKSLRDNEYRCK
ncbi:DUF86 domain-containing protein [Candidatus Lokiarchaeum ossiferum]|uniref:DUF86 domain-containing protein n=1 Tax=Candidatus Lokiarchaeum ossiferum TaxID=2951803 RepID=UPI00352E2AD4